MLYSGGDENNITLVHGGVLSVREKKSLAAFADPKLIAVVIMELGKILRKGEGHGFFVAIQRRIRRQRSEKGYVILQ